MVSFLMFFMLAVTSAKKMGNTIIDVFPYICINTYIPEKCQMPGNAICKSTDIPGIKFTACCDDSIVKCLTWTGEGYVAGDEPDSFCQYVDPIPVGGDCSVSGGSDRKQYLNKFISIRE